MSRLPLPVQSKPDPSNAVGKTYGPDDCLEAVSSCLFCNSRESELECEGVRDLFFRADDGEFSYLRCNGCRSIWLDRRPVGDRLLHAYSAYYTHAALRSSDHRAGLRGVLRESYLRSRFSSSPGPIDSLVMAATRIAGRDNSIIDEQYRFAPKAPASILDYGCGSGEYLLRMKRFGYILHGVEYDPHLLTGLSQQGIAIEDVATIQDDRWHDEFDHITLAHVLEHVPDPQALLRRLFDWLKPGGTLFVEVPNADATGLAIFGRYWRGLEAPRHFSLPAYTALIAAFESVGFAIDRRQVNGSARLWVWEESLGAVPAPDRPEFEAAMQSAPAETQTNAEFLTFVVRKPV